MIRIPLSDFADELGQTQAAKLLKMSQSSINEALRSDRKIFVIRHDDGRIEAEEIKPFPGKSPTQKGIYVKS